jgi:hypothetical protein
LAVDLRGDDGGVSGAFALGDRPGPDGGTGQLVEGSHGGFAAAGSDDELVAVDERRFAVAPAAGRAAEILDQVFTPEFLAFDVEADEVAV